MKPSTRKLFSMLPATLVVRLDLVRGETVGCDLFDGSGKPAAGLDPQYPGFATCLERLIKAGHVIHGGDIIESATPSKQRVARYFFKIHIEPVTKGQNT